jgi:hypothetical protein
MKEYMITAFSRSGEKLYEHAIRASDDHTAIQNSKELLKQEGYSERTHRVCRAGKLLVFKS